MNYRELTAPQLIAKWKEIVNNNVMLARDTHLIKDFLAKGWTTVQVLEGMYQYAEQRTVTIPQFLRQWEQWLEEDEFWSEVELARRITNMTPASYWIYFENQEEQYTVSYQAAKEAKEDLQEWKERVLA